jgi:heme/copper-type cytochrome/quinol oxidase subunit 2
MRRPRALLTSARLIPVLVALSGCNLTLPAGATDQSREISSLYRVVFVIAVAIFLLVEG